MFYSKEMIDWAVSKAENEYAGDIALILADRFANKTPGDGDVSALQFFIPATERGFEASMSYIVEGIGYDFFPVSWERLTNAANLEDNLIFCLAEAEIVYARSEEDRERFESTRKLLFTHLADKVYSYRIAEKRLSELMGIYKNMAFEEDPCALRKAAAFISMFLADIIAIINGDYTKHGEMGTNDPLPCLSRMKLIPEGFTEEVASLPESDTDELPEKCRRMISSVRKLLANSLPESKSPAGDIQELTGWFEESSYTWRRIDYFCKNGDIPNAFYTSAYLQHELDNLRDNYGFTGTDMMQFFDSKDLIAYNEKAQAVMVKIRKQFEEKGLHLRDYATLNDFLKEN